MRTVSVVCLAGDGIGPEVVGETRRVVDIVAAQNGLAVTWTDHIIGGASIDAKNPRG